MIAHQNKVQIPQPVIYDYIQFEDNGQTIRYTDCWQISVFRFLHLLFGQDGVMQMDRLKLWMDQGDARCQKLIGFFQRNNTYEMKRDFYEGEAGKKLRADWARFCNDCGVLNLKICDKKYQVCATIPNLLVFLTTFFPKLSLTTAIPPQTYQNITSKQIFPIYQKALNEIYSQLASKSNFRIETKLSIRVFDEGDYLYFSIIQAIYIDGKNELDWEIYENYVLGDGELDRRLNGHSDYRLPHKRMKDL